MILTPLMILLAVIHTALGSLGLWMYIREPYTFDEPGVAAFMTSMCLLTGLVLFTAAIELNAGV